MRTVLQELSAQKMTSKDVAQLVANVRRVVPFGFISCSCLDQMIVLDVVDARPVPLVELRDALAAVFPAAT